MIHDFLPRHCAGSEIYALELCHAQAEQGLEVHVLCAEYDPTRPHGSLVWRWYEGVPVTELINNWTFGSFEDSYRSPEITAQLEHVLRAVAPDVLHVHNLLNLSFDLPAAAARRGIPSVATLHEYVLLCPSGGQRVHLAEEHVCLEIDPERCARCFRQSHFFSQMAFARLGKPGMVNRLAMAFKRRFPGLFQRLGAAAAARSPGPQVTPEMIKKRLGAAAEVFASVALWVAPSAALGREFLRFGMPEDKLLVTDNGIVPLRPERRTPTEGRLRIGFVGTLVWHKGTHVLIEALRHLPHDRVEVLLFGSVDTFPNYVAQLRQRAEGLPIRFLGSFERSTVARVYAQMDVVVIPSLWLENSPLVIHEAYMAGLPVVGSRLGGTVDLVEEGVSGLLYDPFSPEDLARTLRRLLDEPDLLEHLAAHLPAVKSMDDDAHQWQQRYRQVLAARTGEPA